MYLHVSAQIYHLQGAHNAMFKTNISNAATTNCTTM